MRIVYIHQYFRTPAEPGGTRSYEFARRLVAAGHEVHMVTTLQDGPAPVRSGWFETTEAGIVVHRLVNPYSNAMNRRERLKAFFRFAYHACQRAASLKGDVVFATSTPLTVAIPAVWAARRGRIPIVLEIRDLWPEIPIAMKWLNDPISIAAARWLERFAYRNAARVVALSPDMKRGIVATGYPEDRVVVIPNCADIDLFRVPPERGQEFLRAHPYLEGRILVTYAGTLGQANGVGYLVDVARAMSRLDDAVGFLIVGEGREREAVRRKAEDLGLLGTNLWMLPPLPKRDMPGVLSASTISACLFINVPALWGNSANKFFDSLAAGRPVMINYEGWQADLIREYGVGLVVPPDDPEKAAGLLLEFVRDEERVRQSAGAAARLAVEKFDRDNLAAQLRELLETVVAEWGGSSRSDSGNPSGGRAANSHGSARR